MTDTGRAAVALLICSVALALAELQVRREASTQYLCLALMWVIVVGMLIYVYAGAR